MVDHRIKKLPKWAQIHIANLRMERDKAQTSLKKIAKEFDRRSDTRKAGRDPRSDWP
jgi:hypothetical protein